MIRLGVVSFLNARPLVDGLSQRAEVALAYDVPARLGERLIAGEYDAALVPIVDVLTAPRPLRIISDACIGCDGETMTVRVFSQIPPHRVDRLYADADSHTSVMLARVIWHELFGREIVIEPLARGANYGALQTVLLIGDKVIDPRRGSFAYEIDLGGAWRQHTGLPFVFAVWAMRDEPQSADFSRRCAEIEELLESARDRGQSRAAEIAREQGPALGWPIELAERYLCRRLMFKLTPDAIRGGQRFEESCRSIGLIAPGPALRWPAQLIESRR
ncbi:MAG: menaquinone biosynthesis protein [Phycisphaerales bacterium]|nr:menaquinone biosynthesis protein [Phycisphaerales bacterium]